MKHRRARGHVVAALSLVLAASSAAVVTWSASAAPQEPGFGARAELTRNPATGAVTFVGTEPGRPLAAPGGITASSRPADAARAFVREHAKAFGLAAGSTLRELGTSRQAGGVTAVRLAQSVGDVPVLGGEFVVQLDDANRVVATSGEALASRAVTEPTLAKARAEAIATLHVSRADDVERSRIRAEVQGLRIFDSRIMGGPGLGRPTTVWAVEVSAGPLLRRQVFVDATVGAVVAAVDEVHSAKQRRVCDAANTSNQLPCTAPVLVEGGTYGGGVADVQAAYDLSGATYDFFKSRFNRDSLDGAGMPLVSTVRYCDPSSACPFENAFWDGTQMVYGEGYASADDVVGHELAHGFTDFTSHLFYWYQSGAINESISDVYGELVDLVTNTGADAPADRWLMGEDLPIGAIRDMEDPNAYDQPARMLDPMYFTGVEDGGGVHYNSGVNNKAASLLVDGGTFNGRTVGAIGADKVAALYYEVSTGLLTSASDYQVLAQAMRQACTNLVGGPAGMTTTDCAQVGAAIAATQMDTPRPEATDQVECPASTPQYTWFDDLESGAGWTAQQPWFHPQNDNPFGFDATYATSGDTNFWGYDRDAGEFGTGAVQYTITQDQAVTVPAGAFLRFSHAYSFEHYGFGENYDGGVVEYSENGSTWLNVIDSYPSSVWSGSSSALAGQPAYAETSNGYVTEVAPLGHLAGRTIRLRFRIATDETGWDYGWFVDDIGIGTCGATPPPTTPPTTPPVPTPTTTPTPAPQPASVKAGSVKVSKKKISLGYTVAPAGKLTVVGTAKGLKKELRAGPVSASGSTTVTLKITKALKRLLAKRTVKLKVAATLVTGTGELATSKRTVKLKRR